MPSAQCCQLGTFIRQGNECLVNKMCTRHVYLGGMIIRKVRVNISRIWFPIQTMHTYLNSAWLTGSNSTKNIEILQKLTILEPFYGIRNILDRSICAWSSVFSLISPVFDFRFKQQIHIWNLLDWLVLTVPIKLKHSKNWKF